MKTWVGAALVSLVAMACGGDDDGSVDADAGGGSPDAMADAMVDTSVSVTVYPTPSGPPAANVEVAFNNPDGSLFKSVMTDEAGVASVDGVQAGSSVSFVVPMAAGGSSVTVLTTAFGVDPGDHLTVNAPTHVPPAEVATLKADYEAVGGATSYRLAVGCDSQAGAELTQTVPINDACLDQGAQADVLLVALDGSGALEAQFALDHSITPDVENTAVLSDWAVVAKTPFDYTNLPQNAAPSLYVSHMRGGLHFYGHTSDIESDGASSIPVLPGEFADALHLRFTANPEVGGTLAVLETVPADTTTADLAGKLLPVITDVALKWPGDQPTVTITADGSLDGADVGFVLVSFTPGGGGQAVWQIYTDPADGNEVSLPDLPSSLAALAPDPEATNIAAYATFVEASEVSGYTGFINEQAIRYPMRTCIFESPSTRCSYSSTQEL